MKDSSRVQGARRIIARPISTVRGPEFRNAKMSALPMNWKSTVAVSGATVLATWLGWSPGYQPAATPAIASNAPEAKAGDIQSQADRLQVRVRKELEYRDPTRNPFR